MVAVRSEVAIKAPPESVWGIISDLDGEPRYWKGTTAIRNVSSSGNTVTREITIAFRGKKCMQVVTVHPMERIEAAFTEGIMRGTKTLRIRAADGKAGKGEGPTVLQAEWDISLAGMPGILGGVVGRHIRGGTEQALAAIKSEAERAGPGGQGAAAEAAAAGIGGQEAAQAPC